MTVDMGETDSHRNASTSLEDDDCRSGSPTDVEDVGEGRGDEIKDDNVSQAGEDDIEESSKLVGSSETAKCG